MTKTCPSFFVSHGGGPCFWMEWNPPHLFHGLKSFFETLPQRLGTRPSAIVVISAHWEEKEFTIQSTPEPPMIYDYTGFPPHTYQLKYPASGAPELAKRIAKLLTQSSIQHGFDSIRGYDHGVYVPLLISYPNADIPLIQISLRSDLSPSAHFSLGQALRPLRDENILILGSGFSYHNLRAIPDRRGVSQVFDKWLFETLCELTPNERARRLVDWSSAPSAREAHPREEHLIPLMVCAGAGEFSICERVYSENLPSWNVQTSCFAFY